MNTIILDRFLHKKHYPDQKPRLDTRPLLLKHERELMQR